MNSETLLSLAKTIREDFKWERHKPVPEELAFKLTENIDPDDTVGLADAGCVIALTLIARGHDPSKINVIEDSKEKCYNEFSKSLSERLGFNQNGVGMKFDVVIGNPPYGNAGRDALSFLNKIAELELSRDIRLIMPRSIRKASLLNSIDRHIHIVDDVTNDNMLFGRKIKTVTQRYEYRDELRDLIPQPKTHSDFEFLKKGDPKVNIFVMRSGYAGKVLTEDFHRYEESHYFIHAKNQQVIDNIKSISEDLMVLAEETTGMNKVSIPEIIMTYNNRFGCDS